MEKQLKKIDVLDKGYVILHDTLGTDLTPVNSAKVSYNKQSKEFGAREARLTKFLASEDHTSPFRHAVMQFEVYAPLMVARQWWKYIIGSGHKDIDNLQDPFTAWNESSRRYITEEAEFYVPEPTEWRKAPENSKQGSGEFMTEEEGYINTYELNKLIDICYPQYERAMKRGVAPEQARLFLPAYGMYVRWYWTASLQGVAHFLNQRLAHDAQKEIQDFAQAVQQLAETEFPNSLKEMLK
jgi:thymidylate synthase (FAD)